MERGDGIDEQAVEEAMDVLGGELAARFGALSDTFGEWRKPETARAVLETVLAGDREGFHELLPDGFDGPGGDPLEPPDGRIPRGPKFCTIVAEVVEKLVPMRRVACSRVRTDLTPAEKARYLAIVLSCLRDGTLPPLEPVVFSEGKCKGDRRSGGRIPHSPAGRRACRGLHLPRRRRDPGAADATGADVHVAAREMKAKSVSQSGPGPRTSGDPARHDRKGRS